MVDEDVYDNWKGKTKCSEKTCHFAHHKYHMTRCGIEYRPLGGKMATGYGMAFRVNVFDQIL
jgi:hypothetical protein